MQTGRVRESLVVCASLALLALAPSELAATARPGSSTLCTQARIHNVRLPQATAIDEIRVAVEQDSPAAGAATIRVGDGGEFDRVVRVTGTSRNLIFSPAMIAPAFEISLEPELRSQVPACIDRVELRRGGQLIATLRP